MHCTPCELAKYHNHADKPATERATPHRTLVLPLVGEREFVHFRIRILTFLTDQARHRHKRRNTTTEPSVGAGCQLALLCTHFNSDPCLHIASLNV